MEYAAARARTTAAVHLLWLFALLWPGATAAEEATCPFAEKRPPLGEILKGLPSQRPSLCKANLAGSNLAGVDLTGADLTGATLKGSNLARANLNGIRLGGANLAGSNLAQADLTGADLAGADLTGANLAGAKLYRANLSNANLTEAYLGSADFQNTTLTTVKGLVCDQVRAAKTDRAAKLPEGMTCF